MRWIVRHAPEEIYDTKTDPERFTFREVLAHMVDWEPITLSRMRQAKEQPGSTLVAYDEVQRAIDFNYTATNPLEEVEKWAALRTATVKYLEEEAPGSWDLSVLHPERGKVTLYDLANMEACHDIYHIEQLLEFLS